VEFWVGLEKAVELRFGGRGSLWRGASSPVLGRGWEGCRKDGGKGSGRVDLSGFACYCKKVAMASRVFGRQEGPICGTLEVELHRKVLRLSGLGFLAYWSARLSGGQSVLRPFAIVPATPFTLLEVQRDPM
jgi:hypothetical protein